MWLPLTTRDIGSVGAPTVTDYRCAPVGHQISAAAHRRPARAAGPVAAARRRMPPRAAVRAGGDHATAPAATARGRPARARARRRRARRRRRGSGVGSATAASGGSSADRRGIRRRRSARRRGASASRRASVARRPRASVAASTEVWPRPPRARRSGAPASVDVVGGARRPRRGAGPRRGRPRRSGPRSGRTAGAPSSAPWAAVGAARAAAGLGRAGGRAPAAAPGAGTRRRRCCRRHRCCRRCGRSASVCTTMPRPPQCSHCSVKTSSRPEPTRLRVICTRPSEVTSATWCGCGRGPGTRRRRRSDQVAVGLEHHVDEVDDDDAADVAQPELADDLLGGLEVVLGDGLLEVAARSR